MKCYALKTSDGRYVEITMLGDIYACDKICYATLRTNKDNFIEDFYNALEGYAPPFAVSVVEVEINEVSK